jgi:hypothetical protein
MLRPPAALLRCNPLIPGLHPQAKTRNIAKLPELLTALSQREACR